MSGERTHRLVPFLSGAALAIILDTSLQLTKKREPAPAAEPPSITAVPAQKPGVVAREQPREQAPEAPTLSMTAAPLAAPSPVDPVPEARGPTRAEHAARRPSTPMPSARQIDAAISRALVRRGLELADLDRLDSLRAHVAKLRSARAGTDGRDVEAALEKLLPEIERAPLTHELLAQKVEQVRRLLTQSEAAMEKERFAALQARYLDAKTELSGLQSAPELGAFAVRLAEIAKDIRAAKSAGVP